MSAAPPPARAGDADSPTFKLALDLGPILVFFLANQLAPGDALAKVLTATLCFMIATAAAMIVARLRHGRVSPMLLVSGVMVLAFGGLTLALQSETFIKVKPTVYYACVSSILFFGLWSGRPTIQLVLGQAYPGLSDRGWRLLTRNWACFFVVLGIANEIVWRNGSTAFWLGYKLWGSLPATILFALANLPMLFRHGLMRDDVEVPPTE